MEQKIIAGRYDFALSANIQTRLITSVKICYTWEWEPVFLEPFTYDAETSAILIKIGLEEAE